MEQVPKYMICFQSRGRHPYYLINPLRMEAVIEHPFVFQFYDLFTNAEIEALRWQPSLLNLTEGSKGKNSRVEGFRKQAHDKNQEPLIKN